MALGEGEDRRAASAPGGGHEAMEKEGLRREMRRIRRAIPAHERTRRSDLVTALLWTLPELRRAGVVLSFLSFGSEVDTDGLLFLLEEAGVTVFLPFLESGEMLVAEHRRGDHLVETAYGPREPASRRPAQPGRVEAAVVPGLAFDRGGGRLGYGGGHYDRFLNKLPAAAPVIGIGFSEQVVAEVPLAPTDVRLDIVVTEQEVIFCKGDEPAH